MPALAPFRTPPSSCARVLHASAVPGSALKTPACPPPPRWGSRPSRLSASPLARGRGPPPPWEPGKPGG
eukprot:2931021-Alexandrium_andersonii.AAC.1